MEYEVGSIADLISGNRTPNRPKVARKPLTPSKLSTPPTKVTPRDSKDQMKGKTPKIAFTPETVRSPSTGSQRKGFKNEFDSPKSATKKRKSKLFSNLSTQEQTEIQQNESPVGKKKGKRSFNVSNVEKSFTGNPKGKRKNSINESVPNMSPNKKQKKESLSQESEDDEKDVNTSSNGSAEVDEDVYGSISDGDDDESSDAESNSDDNEEAASDNEEAASDNEEAASDNEEAASDNEDEKESSDEEMAASDDEEKLVKKMDTAEGSDEEDEPSDFKKAAAERVEKKKQRDEKFEPEFVERTLFIGNIPISILQDNYDRILKAKFGKYGQIINIRIRNIPVPDLATKPKLAFIEKKFHPQRSTVTAYIQFDEPSSVEKALVENNSILSGNHLRVDKCYQDKKVPVDARKALFCGGLPFDVEEETLRAFFEKCGEMESVRIIRDNRTQMGKGIAFVNFASADGVELALSMDEEDLKINNRQFRVKRYSPTERAPKDDWRKNKDNKFGNNRNSGGDGNFRGRGGRPFRGGRGGRPFQRGRGGRPFQGGHNQGDKDFGKKRDDQGNKMRKRDFDGGKFKKNTEGGDAGNKPNTDQQFEKKNWTDKQSDYKGLMAKKKKKSNQDKSDMKKKQLSQILTQPPKHVAGV